MRWCRIVIGSLIVAGILFPLSSPTTRAVAGTDFCRTALDRYVLAPESREVRATAVQRVESNGGVILNAEGLLAPGGDPVVIERLPGSDPIVVLDFGQVVSGRVRVATSSSTSPELRIAPSESLRYLGKSGDVEWGTQSAFPWRPGTGTDGAESQQLTFRYLMLYLADDGRVEITDLSLWFTPFLGTPDTYAGCFESSDDELNRIWYAGAYTLELGTVEENGRQRILDGAKRDRHVWIGDVAVAARIEYVTHNRGEAVRDSLADLADRQRDDGSIPPSSFMDYGLILYDYYAWWVVAFADYYAYTGDREFTEEYYDRMRRQVEWFDWHRNANGLLVKDTGIEWSFTLGRNGAVTYVNAVYYQALLQAAGVADSLGYPDDATTWRARAEAIRQAMNQYLFDPARGVYVDSDVDRTHIPQDANALAVLYGIAEPEWQQGILDYLKANHWTPYGSTTVDVSYGYGLIHDKRIWPFAGYFELEARFAVGDDASALDLLRRQWGYMLRSDPASTMWEWMTADGQIENGFASLAHGWSAGPTATLTERVLGVRLTAPSYERFDVVPHPGDLSWARGKVPTPNGDVSVIWTNRADSFTASVTVPEGTVARLGVPLPGANAIVYLDDRLIWRDGTAVEAGVTTDGRYVYVEVQPGDHQAIATTSWTDYPETGQRLHSTFKGFWEANGGLPVFGYPLTGQANEEGRQAQYFERQRFELHPELAGTPYDVLLGLLGTEQAAARGLLGTADFQPDPNAAVRDGCDMVPETGQAVCGRFREYWRGNGLDLGDEGISYRESIALFGYPISREFVDPVTGYITQYFERARFEYHPENAGTQYEVLLGRVGAEALDTLSNESVRFDTVIQPR
mgnify:CR=1 FL=1